MMSPRNTPNDTILKFTHKLWVNCKPLIIKQIKSFGISYTCFRQAFYSG